MKSINNRIKVLGSGLLVAGAFVCAPCSAFDMRSHMHGDEETILVEKQPSEKIPYSSIVKKLGHQLFSIDADELVTFGGTEHKCNIVRSFADLKERAKYRFNVRPEEVEVKLLLEF